ncbi:MAG: hypothetical protein ABW076_16810 [Candidatus Thiodiazotropha sp.]
MTIGIYYALFVSLLSIYALSARYGFLKMKAFSNKIHMIESESDIDDLKKMIKGQMSLAAVTLPSGGLSLLLYVYCGFTDLLSLSDTVLVVILIAANFYFTSIVKKLELEISDLPASSEELIKEKERVVYVWKNKFLPKFDE